MCLLFCRKVMSQPYSCSGSKSYRYTVCRVYLWLWREISSTWQRFTMLLVMPLWSDYNWNKYLKVSIVLQITSSDTDINTILSLQPWHHICNCEIGISLLVVVLLGVCLHCCPNIPICNQGNPFKRASLCQTLEKINQNFLEGIHCFDDSYRRTTLYIYKHTQKKLL